VSAPDTDNAGHKPDAAGEALRVGVYICHCGGNISDVVDVEQIVRAAAALPDVVVCRHNMFMCSDPGQKLIAGDIEEKNLNRVVVAACSPSLHELTFRGTLARSGLNSYLYEHANIREQVSWCSKSDPAGATDKAARLVAAAVAKARKLRPLVQIRSEAEQHVAVIGGGVSGLRAACDLSRRGLKVTLLESSPFLGGRMAQLDNVYPTGENARELLGDLLDQAIHDPNITLYTGAEVIGTSGYIGSFQIDVRLHPRGVGPDFDIARTDAAIAACPETAESEFDYHLTQRKAIYLPYKRGVPPIPAIDWRVCTKCGKCIEAAGGSGISLEESPKEIRLHAGAIVLATGFDHYEPPAGEYGYVENPQVVTLPQFIRMLDPGGPTGGRLERDGSPVRNVCLIHCVGSRQLEGVHPPGPDGKVNDYCSRVCCTAALQAACDIKQRFPDTNVYDFYQDIRTYGRGHEDYYEQACKSGVLFFRWLAQSPPVVEKADGRCDSPLVVKVKDTLTFGEEIVVPGVLVVLATGMMPRDISPLVEMLKLSRSADRFLQEVHPKLRPVELAVGGVVIAGACQAPMDTTEAAAAASAAAVKASALLAKGYIELNPFVATVDAAACTGGADCDAACLDECRAMKAISLVKDEQGREKALVNTALCKGCGMCAAVCPQHAIQVVGWQLNQYEAMVDAIAAD
jgi:heterodisulfide reductase subunit A